MKKLIPVLLLVPLALAQPWAVPGFKAVYSYDWKASGLLALRGKEIYGTITYTFLNITNDKVYMNVTTNVTVVLPNGIKKHLVKTVTVGIPKKASLVFVTNETLRTLKHDRKIKMTCNGGLCIITYSVEQRLNTGLIIKMKGKNVIDLKEMVLKSAWSHSEVYTKTNRKIGTLDVKTELVKLVPPPRGNAR